MVGENYREFSLFNRSEWLLKNMGKFFKLFRGRLLKKIEQEFN
jgi:hypothetical protein